MKTLKLFTLLSFIGAVAAQAAPVLKFGSDGPVAGVFKASGHAAGDQVVEDVPGALKVRSPNFWALQATGSGLALDLSKVEGNDFLAIEVRGTVLDEEPVLRVILVSPDWSSKSEWIFDLSAIHPDEFTMVKARTPLKSPAAVVKARTSLKSPVEGGGAQGLDLARPVGSVQILAGAGRGNRAWSVEVKSLQVVKP